MKNKLSSRWPKALVPLFIFIFFINTLLHAQQQTITGSVTSSSYNKLLAGVSISLKGSAGGTTTDTAGRFSITAPKGAVLVFSFVGYEAAEIIVGNTTALAITLDPVTLSMDQVVVVAYGKQKKESVVGAISTITTKEIKQSPSSNLATTLAGRLPGLVAMQRNGDPGRELIELYIRGRSTLNTQRPLLMVDGVEREFNALDPNDIESVSILKDATATALYGVRGANGVILVTTRRGKSGKPDINFSADQAFTDFTRFPDMVNAYDYATLLNETLINDGGSPKYSPTDLDHYKNHDFPALYPDNNWKDIFIKNSAPQQRYNLNITGGGENVKYFISAGYFTQRGLYKTEYNNEYDYDPDFRNRRYSFRSNLDVNITKTLKATLNAAGYLEKVNSPGYNDNVSEIVGDNLLITPANAYNMLTPDGKVLTYASAVNGPTYGFLNRSGFIEEDRNNLNSTFALEQQLSFVTPGLSAKVQFSFDAQTINKQRRSQDWEHYIAELSATQNAAGDSVVYTYFKGVNSPLSSQQIFSYTSFTNIQASVNYTRSFGNHTLTGLLLYNQDQRIINLQLPFNLRGVAGRATYSYKDRYFTEVNFGYNGSEQFAKNKRYGFFPSYSAGWMLSKENFMSHIDFINVLKLRASYGLAGNDRISSLRFLYQDDYQVGGPGWPGLGAGIVENLIANPDVTWETARKTNLGIDATIFKNITLTAEVFFEKRDDILAQRGTVPMLFGSNAYPPVNLGKVDNQGYEVELGYNKTFAKGTSILIKGNISYAINKIRFIDEPMLPENYKYRLRSTGYSIGQHWGYQTAGFFENEDQIINWADQTRLGGEPQPGDFKYTDQNGDGIISDADIVPIGNTTLPAYNFGLSVSVRFAGFDLSILFQGAAEASRLIGGQGVWENYNFLQHHLDRWTPQRATNGDKIDYPRLSLVSNMNKQVNDFFLDDVSFVRIKNAEIGYTLPQKFTARFAARQVRFYANAFNLAILWDATRYKNYDPEYASAAGGKYPLSRAINFGANILF